MNVIVLGAGIIGVSTAWHLARLGHAVTVVDRQPDAAMETSFANGAQISVSYCEPWASKEAPLKMLKWMTKPDSPLLYRFKLDPHQWRWGLSFLGQCNDAAFERNVKQLVSLGRYSQESLHEMVAATGIEYQRLERGILHYFTSQQGLADGAQGAQLMAQFGVKRKVLTRDQVLMVEPSLGSYGENITGGTFTASDESGDAKVFTQKLVLECKKMGVQFLFNHAIEKVNLSGNRFESVLVQDLNTQGKQVLSGEQVVMAMGSYTTPMLRAMGESLLIYPAKGYSATLKLKRPDMASTVSIIDDTYKVAISRLGDSIRIAGTAELNGYDTSLDSPTAKFRCEALVRRYETVFPGVADTTNPNYWTGLRPSTPTNIPYIGRTKFEGVWVNAGHGTLGWTHGAGSGKALAQLMHGQRPELEFEFFHADQISALNKSQSVGVSASGRRAA
jgi:D-amino-acid dehydrogenase